MLAFPRFDIPFRLYTDESDYGIGAVLSQMQDGAERVILYASRQLTKTKRQQSTTEKEALAMIWSIKQFQQYILNFGHKFVALEVAQKPERSTPKTGTVVDDFAMV